VEAWDALPKLPDAYAWRWLAYHLVQAGHKDDLRQLLLNFGYLQGKLLATDVNALIGDYEQPGAPVQHAFVSIKPLPFLCRFGYAAEQAQRSAVFVNPFAQARPTSNQRLVRNIDQPLTTLFITTLT